MLLPSACEALVLMTQCLVTFALTSEDEEFDFPPGDNPKDFLNAATVEEGIGMPEIIIGVSRWMLWAERGVDCCFAGLLQRFDRLLPRVMFGKPVDLSTLPLPQGVGHQTHPASTTAAPPKDSATDDEGRVKAGFSYVKRDLVRLLGVLCAEEKAVQDRVRACGGIPVVMNLCVVDERNPCESLSFTWASIFRLLSIECPPIAVLRTLSFGPRDSSQALTPYNRFPDLREHAIFTLHNLLEGNTENQRAVDRIRPLSRPPS